MKALIFCGSVLAALAVIAGAIGAHLLKAILSAQQLATFTTAADYQLVHAVGLILIGLMVERFNNVFVRWSGWLILAGIILFSGCLFAWVLTGMTLFVHLVPVGGIAFITGWLALAIGVCRQRRSDTGRAK